MIITVLLCLAAAFNSFFGIILPLMHLHHHHQQQHFFPAYPMHREQELHILFAVVVVDPYLIVIADMVCVVVALSVLLFVVPLLMLLLQTMALLTWDLLLL